MQLQLQDEFLLADGLIGLLDKSSSFMLIQLIFLFTSIIYFKEEASLVVAV